MQLPLLTNSSSKREGGRSSAPFKSLGSNSWARSIHKCPSRALLSKWAKKREASAGAWGKTFCAKRKSIGWKSSLPSQGNNCSIFFSCPQVVVDMFEQAFATYGQEEGTMVGRTSQVFPS